MNISRQIYGLQSCLNRLNETFLPSHFVQVDEPRRGLPHLRQVVSFSWLVIGSFSPRKSTFVPFTMYEKRSVCRIEKLAMRMYLLPFITEKAPQPIND